MTKYLKDVEELINLTHIAQKQLAPACAKVVIEAIRKEENTPELLQLIGTISEQDLSAADLLIAIRANLIK